jgi:hypothetical protein
LSIPTPVLRLDGGGEGTWTSLVEHDPPVVTARRNGMIFVNLRSVPPTDDGAVASALKGI